jgi:hypothetical protein
MVFGVRKRVASATTILTPALSLKEREKSSTGASAGRTPLRKTHKRRMTS